MAPPKFDNAILGVDIPFMGIQADALFTKTQQRVLAVLFGQSDRSFYANEIIALAASGSGAVQRELARLEAAALVTVEQPKIFVKGSEHDIVRIGGTVESGAHRQAQGGSA